MVKSLDAMNGPDSPDVWTTQRLAERPHTDDGAPLARPRHRDLGFVALLSAVTLGLFGFYWVPKLGEELNFVLGVRRYRFWVVLLLGIVTIGLALSVFECCYAYNLQKHPAYQRLPIAKRNLGGLVLTLNLIALIVSIATAGLGLIVAIIIGVWATWLIQDAMNELARSEQN